MGQIRMDDSFYEIAQKIEKHGGRMYLVGGAVRDAQLGKEPHDRDFCVTGLSVDELNALFDMPRVQGKSFPVFILHGCEIALARKERKIGEKHTDFEVLTDKAITIEEDLARRDLTINSMAIDVLTGELVDPFYGAQDLQNKVIRMTTEAYREDPLRVYRTARFAAKFGFEVEEKTLHTMEEMKNELKNLSAERVLAEFRKALLTDHPSVFFETLRKANLLEVHFPEIANLIGVAQPVQYHPEGDAYIHTLEVLDRAVQKTTNGIRWTQKKTDVSAPLSLRKKDELLTSKRYRFKDANELIDSSNPRVQQRELIRFCALVHDFGKGVTPREEWPHHYGHEENGVPLVHAFCERLKVPRTFEKAGILTSRLHMIARKIRYVETSNKGEIDHSD